MCPPISPPYDHVGLFCMTTGGVYDHGIFEVNSLLALPPKKAGRVLRSASLARIRHQRPARQLEIMCKSSRNFTVSRACSGAIPGGLTQISKSRLKVGKPEASGHQCSFKVPVNHPKRPIRSMGGLAICTNPLHVVPDFPEDPIERGASGRIILNNQ
jgi:hypothetical protein